MICQLWNKPSSGSELLPFRQASSWEPDAADGGTLVLWESGSYVVGINSGGLGHTALHGRLTFQGGGTHYTGSYTNEEGVVRGSGTAGLTILGPLQYRVKLVQPVGGRGSQGVSKGRSLLHRMNQLAAACMPPSPNPPLPPDIDPEAE